MSSHEAKSKADDHAITRVAVCGEVSAGKSTVLNALLRDWLLPDNLGAPVRAAATVRWRAQAGIDATYPDQSQRDIPVQGASDALRGAEDISVWTARRHLRRFVLQEVPFTTAEDLTDAQFEAVRASDVLVWVTIASQAWRLTERKILDELRDARPSMAILAISRADKLRTDADRADLMDRVKRETSDYFDDATFIFGARSGLRKASRSRPAWQGTGGADLADKLEACRRRLEEGSSPRGGSTPSDDRAEGSGLSLAPAEILAAQMPRQATQKADEAAIGVFRTRRAVAAPVSEAGTGRAPHLADPGATSPHAPTAKRGRRLNLWIPEIEKSPGSTHDHSSI